MITPDQIGQKESQLRSWKALITTEAWKEFQEVMEGKKVEHLDGLRALAKTAEQRSEHVQASHTMEELAGFAATRISELEGELLTWRRNQAE